MEDPRVFNTERQLSESDTEITTHTPIGRQVSVNRITPSSHRTIRVNREIASEEEMKVAIWRAEHTTWAWDQERYDELCAEWGSLGAPTMYLPRVNIQDLYSLFK